MAASAWRKSPKYSRHCRAAIRLALMTCHTSSTSATKDELGPELKVMLSEAFQLGGPAFLQANMTEGRVALLFQGQEGCTLSKQSTTSQANGPSRCSTRTTIITLSPSSLYDNR